jgi:hypothetical protein
MLPYIIFIFTALVWVLPPFKQQETKYFLYFLILAISDPLVVGLSYLFKILPQQSYVVIEFIIIFSLIKKNFRNKFLVLFAVIGYLLSYKSLANEYLLIISFFLQTVILLIILYHFILSIQEEKGLNLFYMLMVLYQVTLVIKFIVVITDANLGLVQFYLTSIIGIIFGILFTLINISTKNFRLLKEN